MANLLSRTERYAYIRVAVPRQTFDALTHWFGEGQALKHLRLEWERSVARLAAELPPESSQHEPATPC